MADLPPSVRKHVYDLVLQARSPAFLEVSGSGLLRGAGGDLSRYGLSDLPAHCSVAAAVPFLLGLLPVPRGSDPLFLPALEVHDGSVADVLIVEDRGEAWVVLLDATESHDKRQALQQSANDLALLKQKIARILSDRTSGRARTESTEAAAFSEKGDRRDVTVARLEVFLIGDPDQTDAGQLTLSADTLISRVSSAFREAGGLTEVSMGSAVTSVFGLVHGQSRPADLAVTKTLGVLGREMCDEGLSLRAGVASGRSVIALVQKEDTRYLQTLGDPVSTASRLAASADSGEVLIDAPSFRNVEAAKSVFRPSGTISCLDGSTVDLYSNTPK